ncbi:hypothetical protein WDZ92_01365 [Nostoc sp. NIES-2111]
MFFRFLVLAFPLCLMARMSFSQKTSVRKVDCRDVIRTRSGRIVNCRIDAAFSTSVYFSTVPPMDTAEHFLSADSVQAIWPGTKRSRKLLIAKGGYPVKNDPVPEEYLKDFALPPWMKRRYVVLEGFYGASRLYGVAASPPNTYELLAKLRSAPQFILRAGYAGKHGFGGYVWGDMRTNATQNTQYKLTYRYVGGGAGVLYIVALSGQKDIGFFSAKAGIGYGTVRSKLSEIAQEDLTSQGGGMIFDVSSSFSFNIIRYVQLGIDLGAQYGQANAKVIEADTYENLGRVYLGLKIGVCL